MACGTCGGRTPNDIMRQRATVQQSYSPAILPEPAADEELYLIYNDIAATANLKGPVTGITYRWGHNDRIKRRKVVDKNTDWLDPNTEVHLLDARVFVTMRKRTGPAFVHDLMVILPPVLAIDMPGPLATAARNDNIPADAVVSPGRTHTVPTDPPTPLTVTPQNTKADPETVASLLIDLIPLTGNPDVTGLSVKAIGDIVKRGEITVSDAQVWLTTELGTANPRKTAISLLEDYIANNTTVVGDNPPD